MRQRKQRMTRRYSDEDLKSFRNRYSRDRWNELECLVGFKEAYSVRDLPRAEAIAEEHFRGNVNSVRELKRMRRVRELARQYLDLANV